MSKDVKKISSKVLKETKKIVKIGETQAVGFMDFIRSQGVVGLAVGLVLGGAVSVLVRSLIDNVFMPPLGFILGSADGLKGLSLSLGKTVAGKEVLLNYGIFLNDLINFLVIALTIYFVVRLLKVDKFDKKN